MANEKLQADYIDEPHVATPSNPDAGYTRVYRKSDNLKYRKTSTGVETVESSSGGIGGTTGATDNALIRADGTGGSTIQSSAVTLDDSAILSGAIISANLNRMVRGGPSSVTISGGVLTLSVVATPRNIRVAAQTGTADDLDTISAINDNETIWLIADTGDTITVKHGVDNIFLVSGADFDLSEIHPLQLTYRGGNYYEGTGTFGSTGLVDLTTDVTGVLPIANGGTNGSTATAGFDNLAPTTTKGDVIVHNGTDNIRLAVGGNGKVLSAASAETSGLKWVGSLIEIVPAAQLGSSQTTITLSSIPANFQDLLLVVRARSTSTGTSVFVTFNADTGNNYSRNSSAVDGGGTETHSVLNNQVRVACLNASTISTDTSGYFGGLEMHITAYAESAMTRTGNYCTNYFGTATTLSRSEGAFGWENVANAITSIELNLNAGDFDTGTIYALYGIGIAT